MGFRRSFLLLPAIFAWSMATAQDCGPDLVTEPIFSSAAINTIRKLGFQDEIVSLQSSFSKIIIPASNDRAGFKKPWTVLVSHSADNFRFQDVCFVAFISYDDQRRVNVDQVQYAQPENEAVFWKALAADSKMPERKIPISLPLVHGTLTGQLLILPSVAAKLKFKHRIDFEKEDPLAGYAVENVSPPFITETIIYRLKSVRAPIVVDQASSPFSVLAHLGSTPVLDETIVKHRPRLRLVLKPTRSATVYRLISLYEEFID